MFLPSHPVTVSCHPISISPFVSGDRFLSSYCYFSICIRWPFPIILLLFLPLYPMTVSYHPISIPFFVSNDRFLSSIILSPFLHLYLVTVFYASMTSGLIYSLITMPLETAKNRMAFQKPDAVTGTHLYIIRTVGLVSTFYCRNLIHLFRQLWNWCIYLYKINTIQSQLSMILIVIVDFLKLSIKSMKA